MEGFPETVENIVYDNSLYIRIVIKIIINIPQITHMKIVGKKNKLLEKEGRRKNLTYLIQLPSFL